jgi:tetratricopeptide (TPR) repeat protein
VWNLTPDERPAQDFQQLALAYTGQHLDAAGGIAPAEGKEIEQAFQALRPKYPHDFTPAEQRVAAWHRRGALECEQSKLWSGALVHLTELIRREPTHWQHLAQRAKILGEMGRWEEAAADYRKTLEAAPPDHGELLAGLGRAQLELKQWDQAITTLSRAIELVKDDRDLWANRGRAYAERKQYDKAAADLARAVALGRNDVTTWYQEVLLRLAGGDLAGYRRACLRMVRRFADSDNPATGRTLVWSCALAPDAVADLKPLVQRAERLAKEHPKDADYLQTLGAMLYRAGRFEDAARQLEEAVKLRGKDAGDALFLAMAHQRLGHAEEARKWLEKVGQRPKGKSWDQRLALELLRGEADKMVNEAKAK